MKVLLFTLILLSQLFSNEVEEFYTDTKKMISFMNEEIGLKSTEDIYRTAHVIGEYKGILSYYKLFKMYNNYQKIKNTESYDEKLDKKICLDKVTPLQLGKTLVHFLDNNPDFFNKDKALVLFGALSYYKCSSNE